MAELSELNVPELVTLKAGVRSHGFATDFEAGETEPSKVIAQVDPKELAKDSACFLAKLHGLEVPDLLVRDLQKTELTNVLVRMAQWIKKCEHPVAPEIARHLVWVLDSDRLETGEPVLCHNDFRLGNLLFNRGRLSVVLDWDFSGMGNPLQDVG